MIATILNSIAIIILCLSLVLNLMNDRQNESRLNCLENNHIYIGDGLCAPQGWLSPASSTD